jgi:hypothetical protein
MDAGLFEILCTGMPVTSTYAGFSDNFLHSPADDRYFALGQTRMLQQVGVPAHGGMILTPKLSGL